MTQAPLAGLKVLDLGQVYSGPYCTLLLAYLGADVLKIEPLKGDLTRHRVRGAESLAYVLLGSNKRSMTLNLRDERGKQLFLDLVSGADVVVENSAPGAMSRLGLGYEVLSEANQRIIVGSIKGFHPSSPQAGARAMDLTIQAMSAVISATGFPDGPPVKAGAAFADMISGVTLALGIVAAVLERERTGRGQEVVVAMQDAVIPALTSNIASHFESEGRLPERTGNRHAGLAVAPYNVYACTDGWLAILCATDDHWSRLWRIMGDGLAGNQLRFEDMPSRAKHIDEVDEIVGGWTATQPRSAVEAVLTECDIPCAPVRTLSEVLEDPFIRTGGVLPEISHPTLGAIRVVGNPLLMDNAVSDVRAAPLLGEHTSEVLASDLGLLAADEAELRATGVIL